MRISGQRRDSYITVSILKTWNIPNSVKVLRYLLLKWRAALRHFQNYFIDPDQVLDSWFTPHLGNLLGKKDSPFRTSVVSILIKIQPDATVRRYLFTAKSLYMFRVSTAPIIRSTQNCNRSLRYRSKLEESSSTDIILCTPDDGCGGHPKHVEWLCSK